MFWSSLPGLDSTHRHTLTHSLLFHVPGTGPGILIQSLILRNHLCSIHLINEYAISYILDSRFKSVGLGKVILAPGFFTPEFIAVSHQFLLSLHLDN